MQKVIYKFTSGLFSVKNHEKIKGLTGAELNNPQKKCIVKAIIVILKSSSVCTFCAGADLKERIGLRNFETELIVKNLRDTFNQIANLPQPIIGVIHGYALGGGLELALACDLRIVTKSSILGLPETGLAIIGAGGTQRTPRVIGVALAKELIFTGRKLSADESLKIGLVNYVEENGQVANNRAENIASQLIQNVLSAIMKGPIGVRAAKAAINRGMEVDFESGLKIKEQLYYQVCHSQDRLEGLKAFGEKRKPSIQRRMKYIKKFSKQINKDMSTNMRGLNTFITDIRHCSNKEQEEKRVEKELQKIRGKFTSQKGLAGYQKKKYVWKLLYIYILGYEVDFGQQECAFLINSSKFSEKYTGYVATSILVSEKTHDLFTQVASSIRNDLQSVNEINQSLALTMVGTQAPQELVNALHQDVQKLALTESRSTFHVRKKACACLLRMYRKYQDKFQPSLWAQGISQMFDSRHPSLGFMTAATSLLVGTCQLENPSIFEDCTPKLIKLLHKIAIQKDSPGDYNYYATPAPWLQVKILKALSFFSPPPPSTDSHRQLTECLTKIIKKTEVTKSINKNNVDHGILFEAANLVITYNGAVGMELKNDILKLLGIFISVKEPNLRYLGLETMCKFVKLAGDSLEDHLNTIFKSLRDNDISIRKRALDLLYLISSPNTSQRIVEELLSYAENGADLQIKDDLVLKIAILSEKFADNLYWYIDVVVRMINSSGDFVTEDIWFRIIQIIVGFQKEGNIELQKYAATKLFSQLSMPHVHETLICIGAFIISEYSQMLVEQNKEPQKLFDILNKHYTFSTERSRQMLLNAFVKLATKYPELRDQAIMICQIAGEHFDPDIQQRGIEYFSLLMEDDKLLNQIVVKMPPYSEQVQQNNPLTKRIYVMVLNPKEQKDPTLLNQARIQASQEIAMAEQRLQSKPELLQKHLSWLKACPYLSQFQGQIALEGINIMVPPSSEDNNLKSPSITNLNELKILLTTQIGKIVDKPGDLVIQYKSEINGHLGKVSFQFEGTSPIKNLSILVSQTHGMLFNILPIKQGDFPQVMMQVLSYDGNMTLPIASIFFEQNGQQKKHEFHLPIYTNKFVQPVDMPYDKFTKFFDDFTNISNQSYFKLDTFIRNTAPSNIPISEVLKKAGGLLSVGLNLKAQPYPSLENLQMIWACGQLLIKPQEQNNILNLPIMVVISSLEQTNEFLRVGIRCGGNGEVAKNYLKLIMLYLG